VNEVRLNIIDVRGAVNGIVHCGLAEGAIAALSAGPETIAELEGAIERFIRRGENLGGGFQSFRPGEDFEQWDQGTVIIDLAARIVATRSLYCTLQGRGDVEYYEGDRATDVWVAYCLPEDWLLLHSTENGVEVRDALAEYLAGREKRRTERAANQPIDVREILYGRAMIRFIADACAVSKDRRAAEGFRDYDAEAGDPDEARGPDRNLSPSATRLMRLIHGRWLMTPRADLRGRTPREVILEKQHFIDSDMLTREIQWGLLGEAPPPLGRDSNAYKSAGFGSQEFAVYYHLCRYLVRECLTLLKRDSGLDADSLSTGRYSGREDSTDECSGGESLVDWLESMKEAWLSEPNEVFDGRIPGAIIEIERRRIPLPMSEEEIFREEELSEDLVERILTKIKIAPREIREEFASYRGMDKMNGEDLGPRFKYLDIPESEEEGFVLSSYRTREEWKAAKIKRKALDEKYEEIRSKDQETTLEEGEDEGGTRVH